MVTLTTEHGTFEAETESDALKAARQAKRKAVAEDKRREVVRDQAYKNAMIAGYNVLRRLADSALDKPNGNEEHPDRRPSPIKGYEMLKPTFHLFPQVTQEYSWRFNIMIQAVSGTAVLESNFRRPVGILWDHAGFTTVVFLQDIEGDRATYAFAVGVHEDVVSLAELPGVTMDMFTPIKD